ncbi:helix-turn-helix transcriptional regulator [Sporomusa ovata]|uniref:helix-turn-helix transcriptional regulator n=1 Tax=Sporomusa ovata TaxID=2378 RepID=UPI0035B518D1
MAELRKQHKFSQNKLAQLTGISRSTIGEIENHKTPIQDEHAVKLAKAFGIAVEKIYKE